MNGLWEHIKKEALDIADPILEGYVQKYINRSDSLSNLLVNILASKLGNEDFEKKELWPLLTGKLNEIYVEQDLIEYFNRDFACKSYMDTLLLNRGFQALCAYRISHELWKNKAYFSAKWISNRVCEIYGIDIHPAAKIGHGLVLDHSGAVIGETCEIGDNVFLFHNVTLGSKGHFNGDRHPKIQSNVVVGAGATVLGNIIIGKQAVIAAGSVVLENVSPNTMVAGIPAVPKGLAKKLQLKDN